MPSTLQRRLENLCLLYLQRSQNSNANILQRQCEGIAIAKTKCKYTGRKPMPLPDNFERVVARWRAGEITAAEAMRQTGLKPNTFYRRCSQISLAFQRGESI